MMKINQRILAVLDALSDAVVVLCAYIFSTWLYLEVLTDTRNMATIRSLREGMGLGAVMYAAGMVLLLAIFHIYDSTRVRRFRAEAVAIWEASALGLLGIGAVLYLFRLQEFSRGVLAVFFAVSASSLTLKRFLLRKALLAQRRKGVGRKHIIVVGTGALARQYAQDVETESHLGYQVDGFVGMQPAQPLPGYLGTVEALGALLTGSAIDGVVVALGPEELDSVREVIGLCEKHGAKVSVVPFYNDLIPTYPTLEVIGRTKLMNLRSNPLDNLGYAAIKRGFDMLVSGGLLLVLSPLLLLTALGTKLSSPGPVFFRQKRVGRNKRLFTMYKFRSMRVNVEENTAWSKDADPRKTRFGSLIRKCSIDELPQLFNVLRGDMSLIGPRPEIPFYVEQFRESVPLYMVKHQVRPGMTGWAQVNGYRGDTSIPKRVEYDVWYIENWSLGLDLKIMLRTVLGAWLNQEKLTDADKAAKPGA